MANDPKIDLRPAGAVGPAGRRGTAPRFALDKRWLAAARPRQFEADTVPGGANVVAVAPRRRTKRAGWDNPGGEC